VSCWKAFSKASNDTLKGLANTNTSDPLFRVTRKAAEQFVRLLCVPKTKMSDVDDLR